MNDPHHICAILDAAGDTPICPHPNLWREGAEAMEVAMVEAAYDLLLASEIYREYPETATKLLRGVADRAQVFARTLEIAVRTGARLETSAGTEREAASCAAGPKSSPSVTSSAGDESHSQETSAPT